MNEKNGRIERFKIDVKNSEIHLREANHAIDQEKSEHKHKINKLEFARLKATNDLETNKIYLKEAEFALENFE